MLQPAFVVFECRVLAVLAHARPQAPDEMWRALQIDVNQNFAVHFHSPVFGGRGSFRRLGERRMRSGSCSSSSSRPTVSCVALARSDTRSTRPSANRTAA